MIGKLYGRWRLINACISILTYIIRLTNSVDPDIVCRLAVVINCFRDKNQSCMLIGPYFRFVCTYPGTAGVVAVHFIYSKAGIQITICRYAARNEDNTNRPCEVGFIVKHFIETAMRMPKELANNGIFVSVKRRNGLSHPFRSYSDFFFINTIFLGE